jgi:hypothetical protein
MGLPGKRRRGCPRLARYSSPPNAGHSHGT